MAGKAVKEAGFEKQLEQLEALVSTLEQGNMPLEDMLETYEKGMKLGDALGKKLDKAKARLIEIKEGKDGKVTETETELATQTSLIEE